MILDYRIIVILCTIYARETDGQMGPGSGASSETGSGTGPAQLMPAMSTQILSLPSQDPSPSPLSNPEINFMTSFAFTPSPTPSPTMTPVAPTTTPSPNLLAPFSPSPPPPSLITASPSPLQPAPPSPSLPLSVLTSQIVAPTSSPPPSFSLPSATFSPPGSFAPYSPTLPSSRSPSQSPTSEATPPPTANTPLIAGVAFAGGVVAVLVVLIFCVALCCVVSRKRKRKRYVLTTEGSSKHFNLYQVNKQDQSNFISGPLQQDEIVNFGITSDTFGIMSNPTSPTAKPLCVVYSGKSMNAVDPANPKKEYSQTLPSRAKVLRRELTETTFGTPDNSAKEALLETTFKGVSRSTDAIDKVATSQPLTETFQVRDSAKQKDNSTCLQSPLYDKPTATLTSDVVAQQNDGYVFMELVKKQPRQSDVAETASGKAEVADVLSKQHEEGGNSLYDVPKSLQVLDAGTSAGGSSAEVKPDTGGPNAHVMSDEVPTPPFVDTSHYDVPRKLLQERAAVSKKDSNSMLPLVQPPDQLQNPSKERQLKPGPPPPKPVRKTSLENTVLSSRETTAGSPTSSTPNSMKTSISDTSIPMSKPEGIYDVPRSILSPNASSSEPLNVLRDDKHAPPEKERKVSKPKLLPKPSLTSHEEEDESTVRVKPIPKARSRKPPADQ